MHFFHRFAFLLVGLLGFLPLHASEPLNIVTSIPPLNALAAGIAENVTKPTTLVPPEASHHHYALKPSDRHALAEADIVVWIGSDMETFLIKPLSNLSEKTTIIPVMDLPKLVRLPVRTDKNWDAHEHEKNHHANIDPHVWLNPQNAIYIIQVLTKTFVKLDAQHADIYKKNAEKMLKELSALDKQLKEKLHIVQDKYFLVFHDAYQYFEQHYHLSAAGSISASTDLSPGVHRIYQLQQRIKKENIACIFAETGSTPAIVRTLATGTNTKISHLDSMGQGKIFADYLNLLKYDAEQLYNCLAG